MKKIDFIKQLNKFGRVPKTQELLKMIEELEYNWTVLKKWLELNINDLKQDDVYDRTSHECGKIVALESTLAMIKELEEGGNND